MNLPNTLRRGRAAFERRMRAECRITVLGEAVMDPVTGEMGNPETVIYEGKCYTRYPGVAFEAAHNAAGIQIVDSRIIVRVPHSAPVIPVDSVVTMVSDPDNPKTVGTKYRVASVDDQSQSTAQRLLCVDTQKGVTNG